MKDYKEIIENNDFSEKHNQLSGRSYVANVQKITEENREKANKLF
jgi:hypothetical protein